MTSSSEWRRIDAALDEILSLPAADRPAGCVRIAGGDMWLRRELESLVAQMDGEDPILDFPAASRPAEMQFANEGLPGGTRIGAFRLVQLLGRGGMGEVYRAERADGHFEQQVAIKLMRPEVLDRARRFHAERQILAGLEHPNIAGLHDGGVSSDGRLFMVMDLVEGRSITDWCRAHRSTLRQRLQLFLSVCDAVAYAHRKLVIHRDLKPSNVFVTESGEVKLLDFGVASLLDQAPRNQTRTAALTPGYAAPEQLAGGQITTATDVYALGVLLFELLTGANPWEADQQPLGVLVGRVLQADVPLASKFAARQAESPVPAKLISGDLDAIIAMAMRKEPESRYESVTQLHDDIIRSLRAEPVGARNGARWYVLERFLKRNRWQVAAAAILAVAVLGAATGIAWQAHKAKQETARALAVKNFLVKVFRASDPRIAADKPRGQITAKELLDGSVGRIDQDFADQPQLRLELLGLTTEIYGYLGDDERYAALMEKRVSLARRLYGDHHPIVIEGEITDAWASIYAQDYADANRHLAHSDALLHEARLDESELRAEWWVAKERALQATARSSGPRRDALRHAVELFAKINSQSPLYPAALANAATIHFLAADYVGSADLNDRAIKVEEMLEGRDDADLAVIYGNYGDALAKLGRFSEAGSAYGKAEALSLRTEGEHYGTYWRTLQSHASMLFLHGERDEALAMTATMLAAIPADWKANTDDTLAREGYAEILVRDGRAVQAVPILEAALKVLTSRPRHDYDLRYAHLLLGEAYEGAGQIADARDALKWALDDYESNEPSGQPGVLESRERWARFLLGHPRGADDLATARGTLTRVLSEGVAVAPYTTALAEAHADLARMHLKDGDAAAALSELSAAETALGQIQSIYDVRVDEDFALLKSDIFVALRRLPEARAAATLALQLAQRHDSPQSPRVSRASSQLAKLDSIAT